jgi:tetratricopeptide (TPR) repeat protein
MAQQSDEVVALAGASWPLWRELSLRTEGRQRLSPAAARLRPDTPPALEARLRRGLGYVLLNTAAMKAGHEEIERAAILYRALGDLPHLGSALAELAFALLSLDRVEQAEVAIKEALILLEPARWPRTLAMAYSIQSCIEATLGRFDAARAAGDRSARLCKMAGAERMSLVVTANLVQLLLEKGDIEGAVVMGHDTMVQLHDTPHSDLRGFVQGVLVAAHTLRGDLNGALTMAREAAPLLRDHGALFWLFDHLALRVALAGRARDAALIGGYADAVHEKSGHPREPMGRQARARLGALLHEALPEEEIAQLTSLGAQLSEDQTLIIAL